MSALRASLRSKKLQPMVGLNPQSAIIWSLCSFSSCSEWILPDCNVSPDDFQHAAKRIGLRNIAFLRHGNTAPAENGVDFDRRLTDKGRDQSKQAGRTFGVTLQPYWKVLVSPAPRTVETAQLFLEEASASSPSSHENDKQSRIDLTLVQGLYDGTMQPEGSVLFRKLGYAPLHKYVNANDPSDRAVARRVLGQYTTLVAHEIYHHLQEQLERVSSLTADTGAAGGGTLLVVGHAIYLPAAALGVATLCNCSNLTTLLETNTQEARGFCIDVTRSEVKPLNR